MSALREINELHRGSVSLHAPGTSFIRAATILARCKGNKMEAIPVAEEIWGERSAPVAVLKAAIAPATTTDPAWLGVLADNRVAAAEFVSVLRPQTVLGKMAGYRSVPMQTKVQRMTSGSSVSWVGEFKPIPVSTIALDTIELDNYKIAGIVCATADLIRLSSPAADALIRADLIAAVAAWQDSAMLNPAAAAVAGVSPASITNGALQIASTGTALSNVTADLALMFAELTSNNIPLAAPYFLMPAAIATKLSLMNTGGAGFLNVGARGGDLCGVPVIVSNSVQPTNIILLDAAELLVADSDEIDLLDSQEASVQMDSAPDNPATASTVMVSLYQRNLVAFRVTRGINWLMRRPHGIVTLTGVAY